MVTLVREGIHTLEVPVKLAPLDLTTDTHEVCVFTGSSRHKTRFVNFYVPQCGREGRTNGNSTSHRLVSPQGQTSCFAVT